MRSVLTHRMPNAGGSTADSLVPVITIALVLSGILLRFLWLNADPSNQYWAGYLTDEGRWTAIARDLALFHRLDLSSLSLLHLAIAPVYQGLVGLSFMLFGVDFWSARLVSALFGCSSLLLVIVFCRHIGVTAIGLLIAVAALAAQPDLVFLSRLAIPEIVAATFHLLAFVCLYGRAPGTKLYYLAGLLTSVGVATKATTLPLVPLLMVLAVHSSPGNPTDKAKYLTRFLIGMVLPGIPVLVLMPFFIEDVAGFSGIVGTLMRFLGVADYFSIVGYLFNNIEARPVRLALLLALAVAALVCRADVEWRSPLGRAYVGSGIWTLGWVFIGMFLAYYPVRYLIPVLIPIGINLACGVTMLIESNRPAQQHLTYAESIRSTVSALLVGIVLASVLTPMVTAVIFMQAGFDERLTYRIAIFIAILVIVGGAILVAKQSRLRYTLTAFGIIVTCTQLLCLNFVSATTSFWPGDHGLSLDLRVVSAAVSLFLALGLSQFIRNKLAFSQVIGVAVAITLLVASLPEAVRARVEQTFSIRALSIAIGREFASQGIVLSVRADSLFLANRLPATNDIESPVVDRAVFAFGNKGIDRVSGIELIQTQYVNIHPKYKPSNPALLEDPSGKIAVRLYR